MSDEKVARTARRFVLARLAIADAHLRLSRGELGTATLAAAREIRSETDGLGAAASDAMLDLILAIREED